MTKFENLCSAFKQSREEWRAYQERALVVVHKVIYGFTKYLEVPPDRVELQPPNGSPDKRYTVMEAAQLEEDGWWASVLKLRIGTENVYPQISVLFKFRFRIEGMSIAVRLGDSEREHTISLDDERSIEPVYEEAHDAVKRYFNGVQAFLEATAQKPAKIGFM